MFVHLRVRSGYSFLFGAFTLKALIEKVKELGMDSIALIDRNGLYGAVKFYKALPERWNKANNRGGSSF